MAGLCAGLLMSNSQAARPFTEWKLPTGDFYDSESWTFGLPSNTVDAVIDNIGTAKITTPGFDSIGYVYLGSQQYTSGTLEISGAGTADITTMIVGGVNSTGFLRITAGGKLTTFGGPIGSDYLAVGKATVDGAGSNWKVTGSEMVLGGNGLGTLTLQSGGNLTVANGTGTMQMANHPVAEGTLLIGSGGAAGTISASEIYNGEGKANVIFNHNNSAYTFSPKLTGLKTLNGYLNIRHEGTGTTILTGVSALAGGGTAVVNTVTVNVPAVTVASGTLIVSGSILGNLADIIVDDAIVGQEKATGDIAVLASGTLGGTGFVEGTTTVAGTLAPGYLGAGVLKFGGDLSLESTGTVTLELGGKIRGASYDGVDAAGKLTFGGTLRIVLLNGFIPSLNESFDLFSGFSSFAGNFDKVEFSSGQYAAAFNTQTGDLLMTAIPEPGVLGLAACGLAALACKRRRRVLPGASTTQD